MIKATVPKDFYPPIRSTYYIIRRRLFEKIQQYSSELHGNLLDFGCGAKPYQALFKNSTGYTGLDFAGEGHSHENENIDVYYDGITIPFNNETFDAVFSAEVFEHVFNLEQILPEINRVMKLNGKILITCPFLWPEHEVPIDYARYTQFALKHLFEKNGFTVILQDKSGDFAATIHQIKLVYLIEKVIPAIPILGKFKFFTSNIRPPLVSFLNIWFLFSKNFLPINKELYLNNILLAEKNKNI
jgi:SAM-dependent methyltransferase